MDTFELVMEEEPPAPKPAAADQGGAEQDAGAEQGAATDKGVAPMDI